MKINSELFCAATMFARSGVPVFAAFPCVRSVFDFASDPDVLWFALRSNEPESDTVFEFDNVPDRNGLTGLEGPLSDQEICSAVENGSALVSWQQAVECINEVRWQILEGYPKRLFDQHYKPVYFLVWD